MLLFSFLLGFAPHLWIDDFFASLGTEQLNPNANPKLSDPPIVIRSATLDDVDGIARTIVDAFDPSPPWEYVYPFRDKYPTYHLDCVRNRTLAFLQIKDPAFDIIANVIDAPMQTATGVKSTTAVAIAFWALIREGGAPPSTTISKHDCSEQLDANVTRKADFERQLTSAERRYLQDPDGNQLLYLALLATHPDWQGHGFGPAHCLWGQSYAREKQVNITLLATPAGYPVYKDLGFEEVENVTITKVDGDGAFWYEGMKWDVESGSRDEAHFSSTSNL